VPDGNRTDGFMKLVFRGDDRQLLRAHIVGDIAGADLPGQSAMHAGDTIDRFINTRFAVRTRTDFYKDLPFDRTQRSADRTLEGLMRSASVPTGATSLTFGRDLCRCSEVRRTHSPGSDNAS
jgi:hypothetical protein